MNIQITDTCITLGEGVESFLLFEKPALPNYQNVTARPYISIYLGDGATIWSRLQVCTELLADFCHEDPYYGCYALLFRRLCPLLLSLLALLPRPGPLPPPTVALPLNHYLLPGHLAVSLGHD